MHNFLNFHLFFHRQSQAEAEPFAEAFIHETDAKWSFMFNSYRNDTTLDVRPFFFLYLLNIGIGKIANRDHEWVKNIISLYLVHMLDY